MKFADKLYVSMLSIWQNAYKMWIDPTPQDVTLEGVKVDTNGNVSNVTIPNLAKSQKKIDDKIAEMEKWKNNNFIHIEVGSAGLGSNGFRGIAINGNLIQTTGRSYGLVIWDINQNKLIFNATFDIYGNADNAILMSQKIQQYLGHRYLFIINTYDEPQNHHQTKELLDAMALLRANLFQQDFVYRSAYMLITIDGKGEVEERLSNFGGEVRADTYFNQYIKKGV